MSILRANTVLTHVTHVIIISVPSDYTDKKKGENYMKRILALLLTLAMLLTMVGTTAVAADSAAAPAIPEATSTVDNSGNVTIKLSEGTTDFEDGVVELMSKDGKSIYTDVPLTYDKTKKAFVGTEAGAAGGMVVSFHLNKEDDKIANNMGIEYITEGKLKGKVFSADIVKGKKTTKDSVVTKENGAYHEVEYNSETGYLVTDETGTYDISYSDKGIPTSRKYTTERKDYKGSTGRYDGKEISESSYTYTDGEVTASSGTSKIYNEKDVLVGNSETTSTTTYNKAKDAKTEKETDVTKVNSSKGYLKSTKTEGQTDEYEKIDGSFEKQSYKIDEKKTNRDGNLAYTNTTSYKNGKDADYTYSWTSKNYNTYTKAVTEEKSTTEKVADGKYSYTNTYTYNNDDGSLRRKSVERWNSGDKYTSYEYYNKDGKLIATKDKDGTWKDGNGKEIGKNEYKDSGNNESTNVSINNRTGEISSYTKSTTVTTTDGTKTYTRVTVRDGEKTTDTKEITKADKSFERYEKGVLRESRSTKDGIQETKRYDSKGNLVRTEKFDSEKNTRTYYNYQGKVFEVDDYAAGTYTSYDTATGKMTGFQKSISGGWEHYGADSKLLWSWKYDSEKKEDVYYDSKGKEFARTFSKYNSETEETTTQDFYVTGIDEDESFDYGYSWSPQDPANGNAAMHKRVEKYTYDDNGSPEKYTANYTKWDVVNGTKKNEMSRKEETVWTYGDGKDEVKYYKDGTLVQSSETVKNDYDDEVKTTTKYYDWFTAKPTGTEKYIYNGVVDDNEDDPMTYYKRYDKYDNLQEYSETDNTDEWNWKFGYYADGTLKEESWSDGLGYDKNYNPNSSYSAYYYQDGTLSYEATKDGTTSREVQYNRDGTYWSWSDTEDGVTNTWQYDNEGILTGYRWNEQNKDGISSYDQYDAAGNLIYSYEQVYSEYDVDTVTRTDPAGNKWTKKNNDVTLTLKNKGTGWQSAVGKWFYIENGEPVQDEWKKIDGTWYYFNSNGFMETGIFYEANETTSANEKTTYKTYAFSKDDGALTVGGWVNVGTDRYDSWAFTDANGEVVTGWQNIGGQWYYFSDGWDNGQSSANYKEEAEWTQSGNRGYMQTGAAQVWNSDWSSKHTYFFNEDGTWDTTPGWKVATIGNDVEYHYYDNAGREVTGWRVIDGDWYYFNEDGVMKNGWVKSGPSWYYMDPAKGGAMATDGWTEDVYEGWYYVDKNGNYKTGWLQDGNNWYYLKDDGSMAAKEWAKSGSDWYYMDENGAMATGWIQDHGSWYCLKSDGTMKTGWEGSGNTWYYLNEDGTMAADTDVTIDGKTYHFDETGLCTNP